MNKSTCAVSLIALVLGIGGCGTTPRPIDCAKVKTIELGWSESEVRRTLGEPYGALFSGKGGMRYDWVSPDDKDQVNVLFYHEASRPVQSAPAIMIKSCCGGECFVRGMEGLVARFGLDALNKTAQGRALPRQLQFSGTQFHLAYTMNDSEQAMRVVEYLPQSQNFVRRQKMLSVYLHTDIDGSKTPREQLKAVALISQRVGPHSKELYVAKDGKEMIAAFPTQRDGAEYVEYAVTRWLVVPEGVLAQVYSTRKYRSDNNFDMEAFFAREESKASTYAQALQKLPTIIPPEQPKQWYFTRDGSKDDEVWVEPKKSSVAVD